MNTVIAGSGSYIPSNIKKNTDFNSYIFFNENKQLINYNTAEIIAKFQQITGITERRYIDATMSASYMAAEAGLAAIRDAGIDPETIDQLIVAHNFGDVHANTLQPDTVPSLAARVKHMLGIKNTGCVAYDILFGCPGWLQGLIQANAFVKAGIAKTCLVIGTEALSRVSDKYDRDSMIYSDGAGAVVTQIGSEGDSSGIIGHNAASFTDEEVNYICMGKSNYDEDEKAKYLKMQGRKVYEFALKHVPLAIKACLDKSNIDIHEVKKIFIHQANEKMDEAIVKRLFALYNISEVPCSIMPMNIHTLGNSSVATIPTLFNMVTKGLLPGHSINKNDIIVFASVGAGMNINSVCYRV
jgi:3-oxoacyl-[acyl-carrier-protein] synthase-3